MNIRSKSPSFMNLETLRSLEKKNEAKESSWKAKCVDQVFLVCRIPELPTPGLKSVMPERMSKSLRKKPSSALEKVLT